MSDIEPHGEHHHKQVRIKVDSFEADVDEELAPLLVELWKAGMRTVLSCQENRPGVAWIQFFSVDDLTYFLDTVGGCAAVEEDDLYWRITQDADEDGGSWEYALHPMDIAADDEADDDWHEHLPDFAFLPSVRFPRTDLPLLLRHMTFHNAFPPEHYQGRVTQPTGGDLYESLIHVPFGNLPMPDVLDAYIRATCVAAGVGFDQGFLDELTAKLNEKRSANSGLP